MERNNMAFGQKLSEFFFGSDPRMQQASLLNPQQQGLQNQGIQQLMQLLQGGGSQIGGAPGSFEPFAQRARTQFQTQTVPGLAERFTSMGGRHSGAFKAALGNAGAGLEEGLAAQGSQYGLQQNAQLQNLMQLLFGFSSQPSFENLVFQGQPGAFHGLAQGFGEGLGGAVGGFGAAAGNALYNRWNQK
jgi:hypothetical protein